MVFDHQSIHRRIRDLRRVSKRWNSERIQEDLYCHEQIKVVEVHCCLLVCLQFPIGCDNRCTVSGHSNSHQFSFLLSMCIGATESTTNSRASGFVEDGAGNDQTFAGEKIAALSFSFSLRMPFAIFHAPLWAHRSCFKVSFSDVPSNFGA